MVFYPRDTASVMALFRGESHFANDVFAGTVFDSMGWSWVPRNMIAIGILRRPPA